MIKRPAALLFAAVVASFAVPASADEGSGDTAAPAATTAAMTIDVGVLGAQVLQAWDLNAAQLVDVRPARHPDDPSAHAWGIDRLYAGSVLDTLGFEEDDVVLSINGSPTDDHTRTADDLIAWFDAMLERDAVEVEIDRGGQRMVLTFVAVNVPQGAARQMMYGVLRRGYETR